MNKKIIIEVTWCKEYCTKQHKFFTIIDKNVFDFIDLNEEFETYHEGCGDMCCVYDYTIYYKITNSFEINENEISKYSFFIDESDYAIDFKNVLLDKINQ